MRACSQNHRHQPHHCKLCHRRWLLKRHDNEPPSNGFYQRRTTIACQKINVNHSIVIMKDKTIWSHRYEEISETQPIFLISCQFTKTNWRLIHFILVAFLDCRWAGKCIDLLSNPVQFVFGSKLSEFKSLVNIANVDAQRCTNCRKSRYAVNRDCSNTNQPITNCKCGANQMNNNDNNNNEYARARARASNCCWCACLRVFECWLSAHANRFLCVYLNKKEVYKQPTHWVDRKGTRARTHTTCVCVCVISFFISHFSSYVVFLFITVVSRICSFAI